MELSERKKAALEYLKSQNWYKMYIENWGVGGNSLRGRGQRQFFSDEPIRLWITYTMEWSSTPQGHRYWCAIHDMWWHKYQRL